VTFHKTGVMFHQIIILVVVIIICSISFNVIIFLVEKYNFYPIYDDTLQGIFSCYKFNIQLSFKIR
jgi:hypothetical protein